MKTCPKCKIKLKQDIYKSVQIDSCSRCEGVWFDRDELRKAKDRTDDDMRWLDYDPFSLSEGSELTQTKMLCPSCESRLFRTKYSGSDINIDICKECEGIWLDKAELNRILKYVENVLTSTSVKDLSSFSVEEFKEIFTGPENKISEVRDFLAIIFLLQLRYQVEHPWIIKATQTIIREWPLK